MSLPTSGPLANTLVLVLPSGATLTVTDLSEWAWIEPPPAAPPGAMPALELRGLVGAGAWVAVATSETGARVALRSPGGEGLGEARVAWLGHRAIGLRLLPGAVDLLAYLRGPSRPRAVPLSAQAHPAGMNLPASGILANPLSLVLSDGSALALPPDAQWSWENPPPEAPPYATPEVVLGFCGDLLGELSFGRAGMMVELRGRPGAMGEAQVTRWSRSRSSKGEVSCKVYLLLAPHPFDLRRYLSEPVRPLPLTTDELAALVEATRDDDPAGLIPRLLATVAAERERVGPLGVRLASATGEKIQIGQALVLTANGLEIALPKIPGVYMDVRPAGTVPPAAVDERIDTMDAIRPRGTLV